MPVPTHSSDAYRSYLAKAAYLDYRQLMAAKAGGRSAQMIAMMNALESKLAMRYAAEAR